MKLTYHDPKNPINYLFTIPDEVTKFIFTWLIPCDVLKFDTALTSKKWRRYWRRNILKFLISPSYTSDMILKYWEADDFSCALYISVTYLLVGLFDGTVTVWNIRNGFMEKKLTGHSSQVFCFCRISKQQFASGSTDCTIRLWNIELEESVNVLAGHQKTVTSLYFLTTKERLVSGSDDLTIKIWNIETGICEKNLSDDFFSFRIISEKICVSGSLDGKLQIWNLNSGDLINEFQNPTSFQSISKFLLLTNQKIAFLESTNSTLQIWNLQTGKCEKLLITPSAIDPNFLLQLNDGRLVIKYRSYIHSSKLKLTNYYHAYNSKVMECIALLQIENDDHSHSSSLTTTTTTTKTTIDEYIHLQFYVNYHTIRDMIEITAPISYRNSFVSSSIKTTGGERGGGLLAGACSESIIIWNIYTGFCERVTQGHANGIYRILLLPRDTEEGEDDDRLLALSWDNTICIWRPSFR